MNLFTSVRELLDTMIEGDQNDYPSLSTLKFVAYLVHHGCDFFDIMRVMLREELTNCSEDVIRAFISLVPRHRTLKSLGLNDIHGMIARWTATKYHTAPIQDVIRDIQVKCANGQTGLYIYNSNLNPNNVKAANDPYILLIADKEIRFLDLNRKISYQYFNEHGGMHK